MRPAVLCTALVAFVSALAGCGGSTAVSNDAGTGTDSDTDTDTDTGDPVPLTAVDLLVVVDDTMGSLDEEPILAQALFAFTGALLYPLPTSSYAAVDDLRIAAITTNMGFSSDGVNNDDAWPGDMVAACQGFGDNGVFQTSVPASIELVNDAMPCDESAAQCPQGWTCVIEGEGVCHTAGDTSVDCPALGTVWAETTADAPNANFSVQAACLAMRGTDGCGWMQPLQSATKALTREDQLDFVRDDALLAIVVSTNEDDCSMRDGQAMFAEDEIADQSLKQMNIACGNHEEHLFDPSHFFELFNGVKPNAGAVVFVGIVGVPYGEQPGAAACQGFGDEIGNCLEQDEMQLVPEQPIAPDDLTWYFRNACTRNEGDIQVTNAWPARRFVELSYGSFAYDSYIYSVCNADWSPAFDALSDMIAEKLAP